MKQPDILRAHAFAAGLLVVDPIGRAVLVESLVAFLSDRAMHHAEQSLGWFTVLELANRGTVAQVS